MRAAVNSWFRKQKMHRRIASEGFSSQVEGRAPSEIAYITRIALASVLQEHPPNILVVPYFC